MPTLPNQIVTARAEDGTEYKKSLKCSVLNDGTFSVELPEELENGAYAELKMDVCSRTKRIHGPQLNEILNYLRKLAKDFISVEKITTRVIVYAVENQCAFWIESNAELKSCGSHRSNGKWWEGRMGHKFTPNAGYDLPNVYSVGLAAAVYDKHEYRRPSGSTFVYERVRDEDDDSIVTKLNSFVHLSVNPESRMNKQMPYSPEAAEFFYRTMISLCKLAMAVDDFIGDEKNLMTAIQNSQKFFLS